MLDGENIEAGADGVVEDITGGLSFSGSAPEGDPLRKVEPHARPDNVPEKFWDGEKGTLNTDALLKSYSELEKQFSSKESEAKEPEAKEPEAKEPGAKEPEAKEPEAKEPDGKEPEAKEPDAAALAPAMEAAQKTYAETGTLDEATRAPFVAAGISNEQIDLYLQGVKAQEEGLKSAAVKAAGVQDYAEVDAAIKWAADNWSEKKILAFNAQANDVETIGGAVSVLFKDFRDANPGEGKLINAPTGVSHGDVYTDPDAFGRDLAAADKARDPVARRAAIAKQDRTLKSRSGRK